MGHFAAATKTEYNWNELHSYTLYIISSSIYYRRIGYKRSEEPTLLHVKIIKLRFQIKYQVCSRIKVHVFCGILKGSTHFGNVCKIPKCKFVNTVITVTV